MSLNYFLDIFTFYCSVDAKVLICLLNPKPFCLTDQTVHSE